MFDSFDFWKNRVVTRHWRSLSSAAGECACMQLNDSFIPMIEIFSEKQEAGKVKKENRAKKELQAKNKAQILQRRADHWTKEICS